MRIIITIAAAVVLLVGAPAIVYAQDSEDAEILRNAKEHYRLGQDAFKAGKYPDAIKELKKAYLLKRMPALLINIAKTYDKLGDVDNEIYYYKKYLVEAPAEAADRETVKKAIDDAEAKKTRAATQAELPAAERPQAAMVAATPPVAPPPAHKAAPAATSAAQPTVVTPPPAPVKPAPAARAVAMPREWMHTPIDAAPPGQPIDVRVAMPVMKNVKVFVYYRGMGKADFSMLEMKRRGPEKVARIPADDVQGKALQYYIEAKDKAGATVKASGSQADPNIVMLDPTAPLQLVTSTPRSFEGEGVEGAVGEDGAAAAAPRRNIDEEAAPLPGTVAPTRQRSLLTSPTTKEKGKGAGLSKLALAGYIVGGVGVLMAAVGGGVAFYYSGVYAQGVRDDACPSGSFCHQGIDNPNLPYIFGVADSSSPDRIDKALQDKGHLADIMGGVSVGLGSAMLIAGATMVIVDYFQQSKREQPKPKRIRPKRSVEEMPTESSSLGRFIAAPIISPTTVGLAAGVSF